MGGMPILTLCILVAYKKQVKKQEISQSHTADYHMAPRGRVT